MHPATAASTTSSTRSPLPVRLAAVLMVGILSGGILCEAAPAPADEAGSSSSPPGLDKAIQVITRTFRERSASTISGVLPENGKVFLSLASLGGGAGYFGRGQVHLILDRILSRNETIRFGLHARRDPGETRDEGPTVVWCLGVWSFRRYDGLDDERQLHFILTCQKGLCHVMEIREVR